MAKCRTPHKLYLSSRTKAPWMSRISKTKSSSWTAGSSSSNSSSSINSKCRTTCHISSKHKMSIDQIRTNCNNNNKCRVSYKTWQAYRITWKECQISSISRTCRTSLIRETWCRISILLPIWPIWIKAIFRRIFEVCKTCKTWPVPWVFSQVPQATMEVGSWTSLTWVERCRSQHKTWVWQILIN